MALLELIGGVAAITTVVKNARDVLTSGRSPPSDDATFNALFNLWGAMLYETRANCERARLMLERQKKNQLLWAPFTFDVTDAVLPEFFRLAPSPLLTNATTRLVARLRRVDFFQRRGMPGEPTFTDWKEVDPSYRAALGFAHDFMNKGGPAEFNDIVATATEIARSYWKRDANEPMTHLFPAPIDVESAVDDKLL
jgi:hypothetical protein